MKATYTPYSTASPFFGAMPGWIPSVADQERIMAYNLYEQIYWNVPEAFKLMQRGQDKDPIYLPNAKTIVETCHRFLAVNPQFVVDPRVGTPQDQAIVSTLMRQLWAREKMPAQLSMQKRFGLIRGDAIWHIVADPNKPLGRRISIYSVDPASYFPIEDPDLPGHIVGCHLVSQEEDPVAKKIYIRRRTYRKDPTNGSITSELILFETSGWDDRAYGADKLLKQVRVIDPLHTLPPTITALPVYHVKNFSTPEDPFGSSELRGIERVLAGIDQSISDEELTLAMQGLGMYATNSGPPVDENKKEMNWRIGPGEVLELDAGGMGDQKVFFERVPGVPTVAPMLDHIRFLQEQIYESAGTPAIARGRVDVQVAESGISLQLQFSPLLAKTSEQEAEMLPVLNHMHYDLVQGWFPAFEGLAPGINVAVEITTGDPMPVNRDAKIAEIISLATSVPPIISADYARMELTKLGYEFPSTIGADIVAEQEAITTAQNAGLDAYAKRVDEELQREGATQP